MNGGVLNTLEPEKDAKAAADLNDIFRYSCKPVVLFTG